MPVRPEWSIIMSTPLAAPAGRIEPGCPFCVEGYVPASDRILGLGFAPCTACLSPCVALGRCR